MCEESDSCRMCLKTLGDFMSLESSFESSSTETYMDAYNFCTKLSAETNDFLPQIICVECACNLVLVSEVLKKALRSDKVLRELHEKQLVEKVKDEESKLIKLEKELPTICEEERIDIQSCVDNDYEQQFDSVDSDNFLAYEVELEVLEECIDEPINPIKTEETSQTECKVCKKLFSSEEELDEHASCHEKEQTTKKVDIVNHVKNLDSLDEETKLKNKKKPPVKTLICEICGKFFSTNQKLKVHNLVHTKEKHFQCNLCPKRFPTIFRHREHMKIHENIRHHECTFCHQRFFSKNTLKCHLRRHTGERPFKCEICGKSFTQASIMKTHIALHTGKTVECPHCSKKFSRPSHLILHQRSHTGERPYVCHLCPNSYKQKSHLDRHLDTHMGVKHVCEICGKEYTKKSSLNTHMQVHSDTKQFKCKFCSMEFPKRKTYERHMETHKKTDISQENVSNEITEFE